MPSVVIDGSDLGEGSLEFGHSDAFGGFADALQQRLDFDVVDEFRCGIGDDGLGFFAGFGDGFLVFGLKALKVFEGKESDVVEVSDGWLDISRESEV